MTHRARVVTGALLGAFFLAGCSIPEVPDFWHTKKNEPPAPAPAAGDWALVGAGSYAKSDDDEDVDGHVRLQGPTTVYAGYRGEGPGEREFSQQELEEAGFRGFSAPAPAASFEGPKTAKGAARAGSFQPLREVPR
jgi:hypothetical protein